VTQICPDTRGHRRTCGDIRHGTYDIGVHSEPSTQPSSTRSRQWPASLCALHPITGVPAGTGATLFSVTRRSADPVLARHSWGLEASLRRSLRFPRSTHWSSCTRSYIALFSQDSSTFPVASFTFERRTAHCSSEFPLQAIPTSGMETTAWHALYIRPVGNGRSEKVQACTKLALMVSATVVGSFFCGVRDTVWGRTTCSGGYAVILDRGPLVYWFLRLRGGFFLSHFRWLDVDS